MADLQPSRLLTVTVHGRPVRLHPECEDGFRSDRDHGLIYGPYKVTDPRSGLSRWAQSAEEASMIVGFCPYCGRP